MSQQMKDGETYEIIEKEEELTDASTVSVSSVDITEASASASASASVDANDAAANDDEVPRTARQDVRHFILFILFTLFIFTFSIFLF